MFAHLVLAMVVPLSGGEPPQQLKILARGHWPYGAGPEGRNEFVIHSAAELAAASPQKKGDQAPAEAERRALADATRALKVKGIDWKKQMLVVVRIPRAHPSRPAGVVRLEVRGKALTVHYSYYAPVAARPQDRPPTPTTIALLVLAERFDGPVHFRGQRSFPK